MALQAPGGLPALIPAHAFCVLGIAYNAYHGRVPIASETMAAAPIEVHEYQHLTPYPTAEPYYLMATPSTTYFEVCDALNGPIDNGTSITRGECDLPTNYYSVGPTWTIAPSPPFLLFLLCYYYFLRHFIARLGAWLGLKCRAHLAQYTSADWIEIVFPNIIYAVEAHFGIDLLPLFSSHAEAPLLGMLALVVISLTSIYMWTSQARAMLKDFEVTILALETRNAELEQRLVTVQKNDECLQSEPDGEPPQPESDPEAAVPGPPKVELEHEEESTAAGRTDAGHADEASEQEAEASERFGTQVESQQQAPIVPQTQDSSGIAVSEQQSDHEEEIAVEKSSTAPVVDTDLLKFRRLKTLMTSSAARSVNPAAAPEVSPKNSALPRPERKSSKGKEEAFRGDSVLDEAGEVPRAASPVDANGENFSDSDPLEQGGSNSDDESDGDGANDPSPGAAITSSEAQQVETRSASVDRASSGDATELESPSDSQVGSENSTVTQSPSESMHEERLIESCQGAPENTIAGLFSTQGENLEPDAPSEPETAEEAPQEVALGSSVLSSASFEQVSGSQVLPQTAVPDIPYHAEHCEVDSSAPIASRDRHASPLHGVSADVVFVPDSPSLGTKPVHEAMAERHGEEMEVDTAVITYVADDMDDDIAFPGLENAKAEAGSSYDLYDDDLLEMEMAGESGSEQEDEQMGEASFKERDDVSMGSGAGSQADDEMSEASESAANDVSTNDEAYADFVKEAEAAFALTSEDGDHTTLGGNVADASNGGGQETGNRSSSEHLSEDFVDTPLVSGSPRKWPDSKDITYYHDDTESESDDGLTDGEPGGMSDREIDQAGQNDRRVETTSRYILARHDFPTEAEIEAALPVEGIEPNWLLSNFGERVPENRTDEFLALVGTIGKKINDVYFPRSGKSDGNESDGESANGSSKPDAKWQEKEDDVPSPNDRQYPASKATRKDPPTEEEVKILLSARGGLTLKDLLWLFQDRVPENKESEAEFEELVGHVAELDKSSGVYTLRS